MSPQKSKLHDIVARKRFHRGPVVAKGCPLGLTLQEAEDRMKSVFAACAGTAAVLALGLVVFAQTPGQAQPPTQQPTAQAPSQQVTITGCVQPEADYRRAHNLGRGGAAATGAGVGDEFVIVNASMSTTAASTTAAREPGTPPAATGTAGTSGEAYEATGKGEGQLEQYAGKRVEITGTVKPVEKTAGKPAGGIDPMGQDLKLPELEITTVRAASGECPKL